MASLSGARPDLGLSGPFSPKEPGLGDRPRREHPVPAQLLGLRWDPRPGGAPSEDDARAMPAQEVPEEKVPTTLLRATASRAP